jgi:uncharacterized membrane protein YdjX (TVP38/TMEM64 family)
VIRPRRTATGVALGALALLTLAGLMTLAAGTLPRLEPFVRGLGPWGPVAYLGLCALAGVLLVPGSVTKLAAGALFGLGPGLLWGFTGAVLGSVTAFAVARLGRRSWLEARLEKLPRLTHFDHSLARDGLRIAMLTRLSPLIPWNALNYAFGFSRIRTRDFLIASVGMAPSVWLYVLSGDMAREIVVDSATRPTPWWEWALLALGLVATLAATVLVGRKAREALAHEVGELPQ